jgi:hypothetical protein
MDHNKEGVTAVYIVTPNENNPQPPVSPAPDHTKQEEMDTRMSNAQIEIVSANGENTRALAQVNFAEAHSRRVHCYLSLMSEIRVALNYPMVADNQMSSEKINLEKMWDQTDIDRLRARYFSVMDKLFELAEVKKPA